MADGSIIIDTEVNNKKAQAELNRLNRKIESLNNQIYVKRQQQMPLVEQSKQLAAELDLAKEKLYEMQNASTGRYGTDQIKTQQETVRALESEWNRVQSKVESLDSAIQKARSRLVK
jgi:peptidoglycan hydrolase CwlO-like protein